MPKNRLPTELLRSALDHRILLVLGPELSRAAGVDTPARLRAAHSQALRQRVGVDEAGELDAFLARASDAEVAQTARHELGQEDYLSLVRQELSPSAGLPPRLLFALRALPIRRWLTTTTDGVVHRALASFGEEDVELREVIPGPGVEDPIPAPEGGHLLIKLFGDAAEPESLVLTTDDLDAYFRRRPQLADRLGALTDAETPVFIGFGPDDTGFRRLYSLIGPRLAEQRRRAYALMVGATRFDAQWWARRSLRILPFDDLEGVEGAIRELARQVRVHHGPGIPVESERPPLATGGGAEGSSLELELAIAQLSWAQRAWLLPTLSARGDADQTWVATPLSPETGPRASREDRLPALLADGEPGAPARLQGAATATIQEVIGQGSRVVLIGPAGAGKTAMAMSLLARYTEEALSGGGRTLAFYLPVSYLTPAEFDPEPDLLGRMTAHLVRLIPGHSPDKIRQCLERALGEDRALLLLDGLDQVAHTDIPAIRDVLERLRRAYRDANLIVTCRSDAWSPELLPELPVYELLPLDPGQQSTLIAQRAAPQAARQLEGGLRSGLAPWAAVSASNAFDLSLMIEAHRRSGTLPASRTALYDAAIGASLRAAAREQGHPISPWDLRRAVEAIALHALTDPDDLLVDDRLLALIDEARAEPPPGAEPTPAAVLLEALQDEGGPLVGPSVHGTWGFRLPRIQEMLTASAVACQQPRSRRRLIEAHIADRRWRGVWPLLAELLDDGTPVASALLASTEAHARAAVPSTVAASRKLDRRWVEETLMGDGEMAGPVALSLGAQLDDGDRLSVFTAVLQRDSASVNEGGNRLDARVLWTALSGLSQLESDGGPLSRQAAEAIAAWRAAPPAEGEDAPWPGERAEIGAGTFLFDDGGPAPSIRHLHLGAFELAVTPTTVSQWRRYHPAHPMAGADEPFTDANHPAVGMTWYEAAVCAAWYGGRLPTEAEWDKAAAWSAKVQRRRAYPWGDDWDPSRCNTLETWEGGQGSTTPVDQFRDAGASAWGCREMAGNVLEWTSSPRDGRRVLRGGSWMASAAFARNGAALWLTPRVRSMAIGFRMAFDVPGGG